MWKIIKTDTFSEWFCAQDIAAQNDVLETIKVLAAYGPQLGRPYVDTVYDSRHSNMKELIVQSKGRPFRIFFAFDPKRQAVLLVGGNKQVDKRFYKRMITIADKLLDEYLEDDDEKN